MTVAASLPIVVLISGNGSNLQAIIDARNCGKLPVEIRAVISNKPEAYGLERARRAQIPTAIINNRHFSVRAAFDAELRLVIDSYDPALVVLAGFMRILTPEFVEHFRGRMLNIHPSLLPAFRGLHTHRRALQAGVTEHGASVHFVTSDLDGGPVIAQCKVPVNAGDDEATLAARVQIMEHRLYPLVIRWFAEGRLTMNDNHALLDGHLISDPQATAEAELR